MKHVFRTTGKYWAAEDGGVLALFLLLGVVGRVYLGNWRAPALMALLAITSLPNLLRLWRAKLEIDEQCLVVNQPEPVSIEWKEVLYAHLVESHSRPRKSLCLGIGDAQQAQEVLVTLDHFDHQVVWRLVQCYAPPAALAKDARWQTASYEELKVELKELASSLNATLIVSDSWWVKGSAWFLLLTFGFFALFIFPYVGEGRILGTLLSLAFALLGGYGILITGTVEVDQEAITRKVPLGWYSICWDEVKWVCVDPAGSMLFCGDDKYLGISGPTYWSSTGRDEVLNFINAQIELRHLEIKLIPTNYSFSKNTKINR